MCTREEWTSFYQSWTKVHGCMSSLKVNTHTHMHTHTHTHTLTTQSPTHTHTHANMHTHTHAHTYTCKHAHTHTHTHTHTHSHTHTHKHTHTHTLFTSHSSNTSGKINLEDTVTRWKWGVGRLIAESTKTPIVIPLWHVGMEDILPTRSPYIPQLFKVRKDSVIKSIAIACSRQHTAVHTH